MTHLRQLMKSSENSQEIEELLSSYNEMVQQISSQIEYLDIVTTSEKDFVADTVFSTAPEEDDENPYAAQE